MSRKESKHFAKLWEEIERAIEDSASECGSEFRDSCGLVRVKTDKLKETVEKEYRRLRDDLKKECYGRNEEGRQKDAVEDKSLEGDGGNESGQSLDARKIAAVICCALIRKKALAFDEKKAVQLLAEQEELLNQQEKPDRTVLNKWIVDNFFVNYKIAYLAGLRIIFKTLLEDLLRKPDTLEAGKQLAARGRLFQYPRISGLDNFDVNMVLGLGRSDIKNDKIAPFMLALQFYQIEMYARRMLGLDC